MRVIFLDFDGVLVSLRSIRNRHPMGRHACADPEAVAALNYLIAETAACIVVSSCWRIGLTLYELGEIINRHFGINGRVIGVTPRLLVRRLFEGLTGRIEVAAERGDEIDAWLRTGLPVVESYVILDDDGDMGKHKHRLVQTNFDTGLTMADAAKAIAVLKTTQ